jgi:hypothetical protein
VGVPGVDLDDEHVVGVEGVDFVVAEFRVEERDGEVVAAEPAQELLLVL